MVLGVAVGCVGAVAHVSGIFSGIDFRLTNGTLFKVRPSIYVLKKAA